MEIKVTNEQMNEIIRSTNPPYTNKEFEEEHGPNTCAQAGWDPPTDVLFQDGEITLSWEIDNLVLGWNVTVGYFFLHSFAEVETIPITKAEFEEIREDPSKAEVIYYDFDDKLTDGWEGEVEEDD